MSSRELSLPSPAAELGRVGLVPPLGNTVELALVTKARVSQPGGCESRTPCSQLLNIWKSGPHSLQVNRVEAWVQVSQPKGMIAGELTVSSEDSIGWPS